jgi:hypothetical protein
LLAFLATSLVASSARSQEGTIAPPRLGGYVQTRESWQEKVGVTALINRARFSMDGTLPSSFSYRFLVELEASAGARNPATVSLREAFARWTSGSLAITGGQFKTPFSREYLLPVPVLETADFAAVVDSLAPKYDVGAMAEYALGPYATLTAGAFNGEGQNSTANRDSTVMLVGRMTARPFAELALGGSVARDGADSLRWGVEAQVEWLGALVRGEIISRHRRGRDLDRDDLGWYVFTGFRVVPRVQVIARQEDFRRPSVGPSRRVHGTTLGTNVEIVPNRVRLLFEGVRRYTGASDLRTDVLLAQAQLRF